MPETSFVSVQFKLERPHKKSATVEINKLCIYNNMALLSVALARMVIFFLIF